MWGVMALDPRVSTAVEADLRRLYARALGIVRDHQRLIEAIADELLVRRHIGGDRFLEIVEATTKTGVRAHG